MFSRRLHNSVLPEVDNLAVVVTEDYPVFPFTLLTGDSGKNNPPAK